jgi:hypothetical protein
MLGASAGATPSRTLITNGKFCHVRAQNLTLIGWMQVFVPKEV